MSDTPRFPKAGVEFLRALKRNNRRPWFQKRKEQYEQCVKAPMTEFVLALREDLAKFAPEMIADPALSLYRIYRDTRFSKNKKPYKTNAAAIFPRRGLPKHAGAGFYFEIGADGIWVGGGIYMPDPDQIRAVRAYLADHHAEFRSIVESPVFRKKFGEIQGDQLTRVPVGYCADHPAAEYLKHKQWYAGCEFKADFACSPRFYPTLLECFRTLLPFDRFLNTPLVKPARSLAVAWH